MDVRIIANIGINKGYAGDGLLYAAKTAGGTYLGVAMHQETVASVVTEVFRYYRKSQIEALMSSGNIQLASDFNLALLTDVAAPDFVVEGDTNPWPEVDAVVNGSTAVRLFTGQLPYAVKGEGVTTAEIEAMKLPVASVSATQSGAFAAGAGATATGSSLSFIPTDFSLLFSNPIKFVQDNPLFVGIVLAAVYWFRRKKKKPLWLF